MKYGQFIKTVRENGEYTDRREAEHVAVSVLEVLRSRMTPEGAAHLAAQLPEPLDDVLLADAPDLPGSFGVDEFCRRVAERTHAAGTSAQMDASVVLSTVAATVSGGELNRVLSQLPSGYAPLFGEHELSD
ncbi:hypothetical protein BTM25_52960 [Actinomadura rubteroloni]|uniref:DUF2267 domain-containing protein n=1 Tax=Actinomadura rubteroloni TaxID=1926885 RepID=A0A2P4UDF6_9ACTN|nr:DUF2267 domain-containing protein [Actinomadura rubteroloni]POM23090.1 hypothetical protein BTM25_52960 [Actinomadura rubteroloni]